MDITVPREQATKATPKAEHTAHRTAMDRAVSSLTVLPHPESLNQQNGPYLHSSLRIIVGGSTRHRPSQRRDLLKTGNLQMGSKWVMACRTRHATLHDR